MALKISFNRSEPGFWVSGVAHAAMLAAGLFSVSGAKFPDAQEGIPVEVITDNQFSEITKGEKQAEKVQPNSRPRADRVAERQEQRDPGEAKVDAPAPPTRTADMKVADREQLAPTPPPSPPPAAAARAEQQKREEAIKLAERQEAEAAAQAKAAAEAKAKAEAEAKAKAEAEARAEARRVAEAKAKAEADAKAKAEAKRREEEKKAEEAKARKDAEEAKKFDVGDIRQLLANKEKHQSTGATGSQLQKTASLGTQTGSAQRLNPSMRDALGGIIKEQIQRCYTPPVGAMTASVAMPILSVRFNLDGSLATEPSINFAGPSSLDRAVAEAALRAVRRCAPYRIPSQFAPFYEEWKAWYIEFEATQS